MRLAIALMLLVAPACQLVFPLEDSFDLIPHVRPDEEMAGLEDLTIPTNEAHSIHTDSGSAIGSGFTPSQQPIITQEDGTTTDIAIVRVRQLDLEGQLFVDGTIPLVIIADTVLIHGTLDASAVGLKSGPGGGQSKMGNPGQGGLGATDGTSDGSDTGGGGGGNASGAGSGGATTSCQPELDGGSPSTETGDAVITHLRGGGSGGLGGSKCATRADGGGGGGAVQISALTSITIDMSGVIVASGGGGVGGVAGTPCSLQGGGGGGGGAGGAIYLDAPSITNDGSIFAHGGGGGGGADVTLDGRDGHDGFLPGDPNNEAKGGFRLGVGTDGGDGATIDIAQPGMDGRCLANHPNTGGGGGSQGRIVLRGMVIRSGTISPAPAEPPR